MSLGQVMRNLASDMKFHIPFSMFRAFVQSTQHTKQVLTQNKKTNENCPAHLKEQAKRCLWNELIMGTFGNWSILKEIFSLNVLRF